MSEPLESPPIKRAYSVDEACATLGIKRTLLFELIRTKKLTAVKIGRRRLVLSWSLDAYLQSLLAEQAD